MTNDLGFQQLHVGLDQTAEAVDRLIARLAAPGAPRPLVFEAWGGEDGVRYMIGRRPSESRAVAHLLETHLADVALSMGTRPAAVNSVGILAVGAGSLPPVAEPARVLHAVHAAMNACRKDESLGIQVVMGRGHGPRTVPRDLADPTQRTLGAVLLGQRRASGEVRRQIVAHRSQPRIDVTVRVFSIAGPRRRRILLTGLVDALRSIAGPGSRLDVRIDKTNRWQRAVPAWAPLRLAPRELSTLLAWPLDHQELPGLPAAHPRLLPPPRDIETELAVFAKASMPGRERPIGISEVGRTQHLAISGGTGSGKSLILGRLCLDDIAAGRATLLVDPKRQLVDYIIDRVPKEAIDRIVLIDASEPQPVGLNPLDIGDRDPDVVVDGIVSVLKSVFEDGWGPRTEDLLHAGLLSLARSGTSRGMPHTLLDLPRLLTDPAFRRTVVGAVSDDATLSSFWTVFDSLSPTHRAAVIAPPMNKLRKYLLRKNIAAVLGQAQPKFRLRDVFRERRAVLVPLNDALLGPGSAQLLGGLVVAEAWLATMERAAETDPMSHPGMVFIDEVQRFVHLPTSIEDALATSRSYGVAWHVAMQGRSQLPTSFALALELNARNKISFAASPNDAAALARSTRTLTAEDFQSLGRYEIYADLVVDGAPAGWFSARTLPPLPSLGTAEKVRRASRLLAADSTEASSRPPSVVATSPDVGHHKRRRQ